LVDIEISSQQTAMLLRPLTNQTPPDDAAASPSAVRLHECRAGGWEVIGVLGEDALARRLHAMGLWAGVRVEPIARAPFGDPLLFRVQGFRLALRRTEEERVLVKSSDSPT
jgi:ferrous iron transport protein A